MIKNGLENASIRDICSSVGCAKGHIYYYYENKDDLLCAAAEYGLKKMSDDIFAYFFDNVYNIDAFFADCIKSIDYAKKELRFIYQMASSPVYGETMRHSKHRLIYAYDEHAKRLAKMTGGDIKEIKPIIYLFASSIIDYAIWQNHDKTRLQLDFICDLLKKAIRQQDSVISTPPPRKKT